MEINMKEIDGRMSALAQQRDAANNQVVIMAGQITALNAQIEELTAELAKLKEGDKKEDK